MEKEYKVMKSILVGFLCLVILVLVVWVGYAANSAWQGYVWQKQTDAFMEAGRRPYKEDTYGGSTPEETWAMFMDALKKGDVDLASKYFVVEKQEKEKKSISDSIADGSINNWIKELETLSPDKEVIQNSEKQYYSYKYYNTQFKKDLWSPVVFSVNKYTKVWKISVL